MENPTKLDEYIDLQIREKMIRNSQHGLKKHILLYLNNTYLKKIGLLNDLTERKLLRERFTTSIELIDEHLLDIKETLTNSLTHHNTQK